MRIVLLPTALVTLAAVLVYLWTIVMVSRARARHGVKAPAMTGPEPFERAVRVQMNTLEQLVPFLAVLWICATIFPLPAAILGTVWVIGRVIYAVAYWSDAAKRGLGFTIAGVATLALLLGALYGTIIGWLG